MMKRNRIIIFLITALAVAMVLFTVLNNEKKAADTTNAPIDFTLTDQYGKEHKLSDYKGKVIFVNFWATWCPPCRNELPAFQEAYESHGKNEKDVIILGVYAPGFDKEGSSKEVISFFEEQGLSYPILADEGGKFFAKYSISALPTTVMIDKNWNEATRNTGEMTISEVKQMIQRVSER